jgi:hypothetical protein
MKRALSLIVALAFFTFFSTGLFADEICVIVKTGASSFWQNVQTGAMDAQKDLKKMTPKLSVTFLGPQPRRSGTPNDFDSPHAVVPTVSAGASVGDGRVAATLPPMSVVVLELSRQ